MQIFISSDGDLGRLDIDVPGRTRLSASKITSSRGIDGPKTFRE
ncbi:hypothetical protein PIIN_11630 [Serendipita indica DSM 11827]|uniref:Uncharacterized protein n=1 Tax=Serendipita indica (strain DSM 11827) TaxID=1109443 RepID=G4U259_SERID|nr:hypothetical protein PIIN_11630 [Serendipita indica DSM 11827]